MSHRHLTTRESESMRSLRTRIRACPPRPHRHDTSRPAHCSEERRSKSAALSALLENALQVAWERCFPPSHTPEFDSERNFAQALQGLADVLRYPTQSSLRAE